MKIAELELSLKTNLAEFKTDMQKAVKTVEGTAAQIGKITSGIQAGLAAVGGAAIFGKMVSEAAEAEKIMAKVNAVIRSTGGVAGVTAKQVSDLANEISNLTGVDDDAIAEAEGLLLTFTKIGKDVFPQATKAIVDMSIAMKQDLKSSAIQVGKALNDPKEGISALQRVGVAFTASQKAVIESLVKTGEVAKAQKMIIAELETEFGGAGAAARDTLGGALDALKVNVDNLFQVMGSSGGGSLRYAIEAVNLGLEKLIASGPQIEAFFNIGIDLTKIWAQFLAVNLMDAINMTWQGINTVARNMANLYSSASDFMSGKGFHFKVESTFGQDIFAGWKKAAGDFDKELQDRLKKWHEAASNYKGSAEKGNPLLGPTDDDLKKLESVLKHGKALMDKHIQEATSGWHELQKEVENSKPPDTITKAADEAERWLDITIDGVGALAKQKEELIATLEKDKEKLRLMQAQKILGENMYNSTEAYNKALGEVVEKLKEMDKLQSDSKIKEKLKGYEEEQKYLEMALAGREKEADILKEVDQALKDLNLTKEEEDKLRPKLEEEITKRNALKDAIEAQKKAAKELEEAQKKAYESIHKTVQKVADSFVDGIKNGKSMKEVLKDLGKEMAALAAKKLLIDPLVNNATNWIYQKMYGQAPPGAAGAAGAAGGTGGGLLGGLGGFFGGLFKGKSGGPQPFKLPGMKAPGTLAGGANNGMDALTQRIGHILDNTSRIVDLLGGGPSNPGNGSGAPGTSSGAALGQLGGLITQSAQGAAWKVFMVNCPCPSGLAQGNGPPGGQGGIGTPGGGGGGGGGPIQSTGPLYSTGPAKIYGPVSGPASSSTTKTSQSESSESSFSSGLGNLGMAAGLMALLAGLMGGGQPAMANRDFGMMQLPAMDTGPQLITNQTQAAAAATRDAEFRLRDFNAVYNQPGSSIDPRWIANQQLAITNQGRQQNDILNKTQWFYGYQPQYSASGQSYYQGGGGASAYSSGWGSMFNGMQIGAMNSMGGGYDPEPARAPYVRGAGPGGVSSLLASGGNGIRNYQWGADDWRRTPLVQNPDPQYSPYYASLGGGSFEPYGGDAMARNAEALAKFLDWQQNRDWQQNQATEPYYAQGNPLKSGRTNIPFQFHFADGGRPPLGRPSLIGERGPELFVPDTSGTIMSNEALRSAAANRGAPKVSLVNNAPMQLEPEVTSGPDGDLRITLNQAVAAGLQSNAGQRSLKQTGNWQTRPVKRA